MKYLKLSYHELGVFVVLISALALRILLAHEYWPLPNSDEATIGLMAMHIQHGELPIFFYGQYYMGALEAYIAAPLFSLFGVSIFTLRLSLILLFTLFLVTMYLLVRTLYTRNFALLTILLLSLGSNAVLSRELSAIGGYMETLLFASFAFLLATWLALSADKPGRKGWLWRLVGYAAWGVVIGLGMWSDLLILPVVVCSGLILLLFCWRELARGAIIPLLLFFLLGAAPLIIYNIHAAPGQDSWTVLMSLQGHEPLTLHTLKFQVRTTLEWSIPTITGYPLCHYSEFTWLSLLGYAVSHDPTPRCYAINVGWSLSYLGLFGLSMSLLGITFWKTLFPFHIHTLDYAKRTLLIKTSVQCALGVSGILTLLLFLRSDSPTIWPAIGSRYLIILWVIAPLVLWPLWKWASHFKQAFSTWNIFRLGLSSISGGILTVILLIFCFGTARTLYEIPTAIQARQYEQGFIDGLQKAGITHIYGDYWTCNRLIFETRERVICAVIDENLQKGVTRGEQYFTTVSHDPQSSYVFSSGSTTIIAKIEQKLQQEKIHYHYFIIEGYTVIQPIATITNVTKSRTPRQFSPLIY